MKILIIGSEGFIGKSCINHFLSLNYDVYGCDLLDIKNSSYKYSKISRLSPTFDDIFKKISPNVCINAAGSGSVPLSIAHPKGDFDANTVDTFSLLDCIRTFSPDCKYINISSAAVYGNPQKLPINEQAVLEPLSPYGWHKYYSELICKEFSNLYGIETCSIRPFSVYGPGLKKQLFWDLYKKSIAVDTVSLFGNGTESRDFIYIDDLVKIIEIVAHRKELNGEVINAANGVEVTIAEAGRIFYDFFDRPLSILFTNEERIGDPKNWLADIGSIKSWGYRSQISLKEGLRFYYDWLQNL